MIFYFNKIINNSAGFGFILYRVAMDAILKYRFVDITDNEEQVLEKQNTENKVLQLLLGPVAEFEAKIAEQERQFKVQINEQYLQFKAHIKNQYLQFKAQINEQHLQFKAQIKDHEQQFLKNRVKQEKQFFEQFYVDSTKKL